MTRRVDQVDEVFLSFSFSLCLPLRHAEVQADGGTFHCDASSLLIWSRVKATDLAREFGGDDAICGD
jgi:hypothetical protein